MGDAVASGHDASAMWLTGEVPEGPPRGRGTGPRYQGERLALKTAESWAPWLLLQQTNSKDLLEAPNGGHCSNREPAAVARHARPGVRG